MADDAPARNKGGRPAKYPGEGRRPTLSLRVRGGLYEKLKAASEKSERTISEEMERRIDQSFEIADLSEKIAQFSEERVRKYFRIAAGGEEPLAIGLRFAQVYSKASHDAASKWRTKDECRDFLIAALVKEIPDIVDFSEAILPKFHQED